MSKKKILTVPDPILRKISQPVKKVDEENPHRNASATTHNAKNVHQVQEAS